MTTRDLEPPLTAWDPDKTGNQYPSIVHQSSYAYLHWKNTRLVTSMITNMRVTSIVTRVVG